MPGVREADTVIEWRICKRCGKELPLTLFRKDRDGHKRDICGPCYQAIRHAATMEYYRALKPRSPPHGRLWTEDEFETIRKSVGKSTKEVAKMIDRTPNAVRKILPTLGLHMEDCKIAPKNPAPGKG